LPHRQTGIPPLATVDSSNEFPNQPFEGRNNLCRFQAKVLAEHPLIDDRIARNGNVSGASFGGGAFQYLWFTLLLLQSGRKTWTPLLSYPMPETGYDP